MKESWQPMPGLDTYAVSDLGRVKGPRGIRKLVEHGNGYRQVGVWKDGRSVTYLVHRLVMEAFVGFDSREINHIDGDKTNNRLSNLEYCSRRENVCHAIKNKLAVVPPGGGKLTEEMVLQIKRRVLVGERVSRIAPDFGVTPECISAIKHQRTWAWLKC
jgi:hypothetical protein